MLSKRYIRNLLIVTAISLMPAFYFIKLQPNGQGVSLSLSYILGGSLFDRDTYPLLLLSVLLPDISMCYLFTDYMRDDFETLGVYVFTRTGNRSRWIWKKTLHLALYVGVYEITRILSLLPMSFSHDCIFTQNSITLVSVAVPVFALNFLQLFSFLLLLNLLGIFYDPVKCFLGVMGIHLVLLFLYIFLCHKTAAEWVVFLLPNLQGVYAWHTDSIDLPPGSGVQYFTIVYSVLYLILVNIVLWISGIQKIKKMDII